MVEETPSQIKRAHPVEFQSTGPQNLSAPAGGLSILLFLFFVSGSTALAGEVVLNRLLTYVFGASHLATATVLAAYMGGLSAGAFLFGRLTIRFRNPVRVYSYLELSVALFFLAVPFVFQDFRDLGLALGRLFVDRPGLLTLLRFGLSFGFVFVPTILMGGTLPTLVAGVGGKDVMTGQLPLLYAFNTLGGALGVLLSGYLSIFLFGLDGTLFICSMMNLAVAIGSFVLSLRLARGKSVVSEAPTMKAAAVVEPHRLRAMPGADWALGSAVVCWLAFLQGTLVFTLEVVWSHLIRTVIGVTTYAFTTMLSAILLGIGLGSLLLPWLARRRRHPPLVIYIGAQLLLAAGVVASLFLWDRFPEVIQLTRSYKYHWSFAEREVVRFLFSIILLAPASLAMGISLPSLAASVRSPEPGGPAKPGAWVGLVFGANTLGAIVGALVCGFVLLGRVSSAHILMGSAVGALVLASAALTGARTAELRSAGLGARGYKFGLVVLFCVIAILAFPGWDEARLTSGAHYYWNFYSSSDGDQPEFFQEDAQYGFITVDRLASGNKVLKTNGKYEGTDEVLEFQNNFAFVGALYLQRFNRCALVGLGPGRTLAFLYEMPFEKIDVVEHSPGIIAAARQEFSTFVGAPFRDKDRVRLIIDDGRNHLQMASPGFDYIVVGITGAAFAGVGSLYSYDFFDAVRSKLDERGVFLLWIQLHHVLEADVRNVIYTLRQAFPHVHFYATRTQGFLVASSSPLEIHPRVAEQLSQGPRAREMMKAARMESLSEFVALNVFTGDDELNRYFRSQAFATPPVLYTDFKPTFEYTAPFGAATWITYVDFQPFSDAKLPDFLPPLEEGEAAGLLGLRLSLAERPRQAIEAFERSERLLNRPRWRRQIEEQKKLLPR